MLAKIAVLITNINQIIETTAHLYENKDLKKFIYLDDFLLLKLSINSFFLKYYYSFMITLS